MKIQILDKSKKKKIVSVLGIFGLRKISELFIRTGKERIRAYSGNLSKDEIMSIWSILPVEGIGLYIGKEIIDRNGVREVRLSVDGIHIWEEQIKSRIFILDKKQEEEWFLGKNIEIDGGMGEGGFYAVKSSDGKDFVGMGKISEDKKTLFNFLPKERRRKIQVF